MRGRKKVTVEVGEETRHHLEAVLEEIHSLHDLVEELLATAKEIEAEIEKQVAMVVEATEGAYNGTAQPQDEMDAVQAAARRIADSYNGVEETPNPFPEEPTIAWDADDDSRRKDGPFTRVPRHKQVKWLLDVPLADGQWHSAFEIADREANDERHLRYLRHAISARLREMWEEGLLDRRRSASKPRSLFDYRIKQAR